ncbi:MAG TPA: hypothetical protein VIN40_07580 [Candidatus Tyrphobacter sp.]
MARPRFSLEPLLEARRRIEEERREAYERAVAGLQAAAKDRAVLEKLELRQREAWLVRERRQEEREAQDNMRVRR